MKLSVSLYSCNPLIRDGKKDIYEVMTFYKSCGVKYVEIVDMYTKSDDEIKKVKEFLNQNDMAVSSFSASNDFAVFDDEVWEKNIELVKQACDRAVYFGTNIVRVFAGNVNKDNPKTYEECVGRIIDGFKRCVGYAKDRGVYLCLENHGMLAGKPEQVKYIIDSVGSTNLKATTDTGNFNLVGSDPYESIKMLFDKVGHVHFKDMIETESGGWTTPEGKHFLGCAIGSGVVELERIVKFLADSGYKGYISLEYEAPERECLEAVRSGIEFTQSMIDKYSK